MLCSSGSLKKKNITLLFVYTGKGYSSHPRPCSEAAPACWAVLIERHVICWLWPRSASQPCAFASHWTDPWSEAKGGERNRNTVWNWFVLIRNFIGLSQSRLSLCRAHTQRECENKVKGSAGVMRRRNRTHGLRLMSSLKFSGALFLFLFSASHLSLVHVIWTFSGGASTTSSSSSEYRLPIRTKECLSFTSWACECQGIIIRFVYMQVCYKPCCEQQVTVTSREDSTHKKKNMKTQQQWLEINIPLSVFLHWTASFASTSGTSAPSLTFARRCRLRCHCHAAECKHHLSVKSALKQTSLWLFSWNTINMFWFSVPQWTSGFSYSLYCRVTLMRSCF